MRWWLAVLVTCVSRDTSLLRALVACVLRGSSVLRVLVTCASRGTSLLRALLTCASRGSSLLRALANGRQWCFTDGELNKTRRVKPRRTRTFEKRESRTGTTDLLGCLLHIPLVHEWLRYLNCIFCLASLASLIVVSQEGARLHLSIVQTFPERCSSTFIDCTNIVIRKSIAGIFRVL